MNFKGPWRFGVLNQFDEDLGYHVFAAKPFEYNSGGLSGNPAIVDSEGEEVVGCNEYDVFGRIETRRLLTTAPELFDALRELLNAWDDCQNPEDGVACDARAAIAKALGLPNAE